MNGLRTCEAAWNDKRGHLSIAAGVQSSRIEPGDLLAFLERWLHDAGRPLADPPIDGASHQVLSVQRRTLKKQSRPAE